MPVEDFRSAVGIDWSIRVIPPRLTAQFGASFEATTFRLASAHQDVAAAGLLKYRRRKEEQRTAERAEAAKAQGSLFSRANLGTAVPEPKYRRQSFHVSDNFPERFTVRWNKSFDENSVVYRAVNSSTALRHDEPLPNGTSVLGRLESIAAPYQREDADLNHPDLLFLWTAI
jgi:hypothetical protein